MVQGFPGVLIGRLYMPARAPTGVLAGAVSDRWSHRNFCQFSETHLSHLMSLR